MEYKASRFNYNTALDEDSYVWMNGVSRGAFKVNRKIHAKVQAILADPNNGDTEQDKSLRDQLVSLGFLIEDNFDEIGFLKLRNRIARYGNEGLGEDYLTQLMRARSETAAANCKDGSMISVITK